MARAPSGSRRRAGGSRRASVAGGGGGSSSSSSGESVRKGTWTVEEDAVLLEHVRVHGPRDWSSIRSKGLLRRTGKSCRLRWVNKLRPNLKSGCKFSAEEERVVLDLQAKFGNKWARIATYLPGRTDNDVKNFWSTRQKRLARLMRPPRPGRPGKNLGAKKAAASSPASPSLARCHQTFYPDQVPFEGSSSSGQCRAETPSVDAQNDPLVPYDQTGFQLLDSGGAFLPTFPAPDMEACSSNAAQLLPRTDIDVTNTWDSSQEPSGRLLHTPLPRQPPTSSLQPPPSVGPFLEPVPFDSSSSGGQCHGGTAFMDAHKCELLPYDQTTTGSQFFGIEGAQPPVALTTDSQASSSASLWPPQLPLYEPPYPLLDFSGMSGDIAPGFVSSTGATYDFDYHEDLLPFMQSSQMTFPLSGTHDGVKIEPRVFSPNHFDDLPPDMFDSADPLPPASSPSRTISDP